MFIKIRNNKSYKLMIGKTSQKEVHETVQIHITNYCDIKKNNKFVKEKNIFLKILDF